MNSLVSSFASPLCFASSEYHDVLSTAYCKGILNRLRKQLDNHDGSASLFDAHIPELSAHIPVSRECWQPELGAIQQRLDERHQLAAVAQALFALHALQLPISWSVSLQPRTRFSFAGHFFSVVGAIEVEGGEAELRIRSDRCNVDLCFRRISGRWECQSGHTDPLWAYSAPTFVSHEELRHVYVHDWNEPDVTIDDVVVEWPIAERSGRESLASSAAESIRDGLVALQAANPLYFEWASTLFRGVAATPLGHDDMRQSGSYIHHPGVFNCGFPGFACESTAEVIVHEISHQNYLLLNSVYPLCNDNIDGLIYSSLKGKERSLSRVLFAYHAAANMALFWNDLARKKPLNEYYLHEKSTMDKHVNALAQALNGARGFTDAGKRFFDLQYALLKERDILQLSR
jgi:HEXXH motif-containing protein